MLYDVILGSLLSRRVDPLVPVLQETASDNMTTFAAKNAVYSAVYTTALVFRGQYLALIGCQNHATFLDHVCPGGAEFRRPYTRHTAAMRAANRLRARLVPTRSGAYISSWGPLNDPRGRSSSAIDTMANLPLLYWATRQSGDASFLYAGEAHARKTAEAFIRPDGSTYHAVEYNPISGERIRGYTFQGYADESLWPRGQGWAIYGYAATARATGNQAYLEQATRLAEHYLKRLGESCVPPWDFDDPAVPHTLRDSAAAAIVSSAMLEISALHPNLQDQKLWRERALAMLDGLCKDYLARSSAHRGLLMHGCYSRPHNEGVDSATMFGDFYFVEALCKLTMPGRFRHQTAALN